MFTFAMPYMNGPLHMGHLFTMMKAELASRFHESETGQRALFPFGFHCTGMPIYAAACKLKAGDKGVEKILLDLGIPDHEIQTFHDPEHWVRYFPERALRDLQRTNMNVDYTRSFVTTSLNPVYDSFIRWQYTRLQRYMSFEGRYGIYSLKDAQPCADHDRQRGEGVLPVAHKIYLIKGQLALEKADSYMGADITDVELDDKTYCVPKAGRGVHVQYNGVSCYVTEEWYANLKAQRADIEKCGEDGNTGADVVRDLGHVIYLPGAQVLSRSGDNCIVAITDQWYIRYSDSDWKESVVNQIKAMTIHDEEVRKGLLIAAENMHDWCVSREYGLGTRIPWDPKFLIDSLSDSTIYMAYYTVAPLLQSNIYGEGDKARSVEFWDYVFLGPESGDKVDESEQGLAQACHEAFRAQYPVLLRVSAKDLIYNHLVMSIYHHMAIWGEAYCPKEYRVNGYVNIDGKKMSKSEGNFITVHELTQKYRQDVWRVMLAEASDGQNDANIRLSTAASVQAALAEYYALQEQPEPEPGSAVASSGIVTEVFKAQLLDSLHRVHHAYTVGRFRDGLTEGWRKTSKYLAQYKRDCERTGTEIDRSNMAMFSLVQRYTMAPILGISVPRADNANVDMCLQVAYNPDLVLARDYCTPLDGKLHDGCTVTVHRDVVASSAWNFIERWLGTYGCVQIKEDTTVLHASRDPFKIKPRV